ncbi:MAG: hypothetical protein K5917_00080, partial [Clostridiales bacterium]|nr:hypothetical protein [Clostridiales bacterium]
LGAIVAGLAILFFAGACSNGTEGAGAVGAVSFSIDAKMNEKIREAAALLCQQNAGAFSFDQEESVDDQQSEDGSFLTLDLKGDYSATKIVKVEKEQTVNFDAVPVDSVVWVEATAYQMANGQKTLLYTGKSQSITVAAGQNKLSLTMKRASQGDSGQDDESEQEAEPEPEPEPEPQTVYVEIYVSASGQNYDATDYNQGSEDQPFKTLYDAEQKIIALNDASANYKILVDGEITGNPPDDPPTGYANYGRAELTSNLTAAYAKSILICGKNELEDGVPQDSINRGIYAYQNAVTNGSVLYIGTSVPVTIQNLKITGGGNASGAGLLIESGATVKLADGVLIIQNNGGSTNSRGGGVKNQGTLFVYGSAVIGNKDATDFAVGDSSVTYLTDGTNGNYAVSGGGIFNGENIDETSSDIVAKLYLGYKGLDASENPIEEPWTGGIYANGTIKGGAIYNCKGCSAYLASGTLKYNAASDKGGGVYNEEGAYFEMKDGSVLSNTATRNNANGGGFSSNGELHIKGGTIQSNVVTSTGHGGAIYSGGSLYITGGTFESNQATERGGAVDFQHDITGAKLEITGGTFKNNKSGKGGGIYCYGRKSDFTPIIKDATFEGNTVMSASAEGQNGGAIYVDASEAASGTMSLRFGGNISMTSSEAKNNDIYFESYVPITLIKSLAETSQLYLMYYSTVATSLADSANTENPVLKTIEGDTNVSISTEYSKFSVRPYSGTTTYYINSSGFLRQN